RASPRSGPRGRGGGRGARPPPTHLPPPRRSLAGLLWPDGGRTGLVGEDVKAIDVAVDAGWMVRTGGQPRERQAPRVTAAIRRRQRRPGRAGRGAARWRRGRGSAPADGAGQRTAGAARIAGSAV